MKKGQLTPVLEEAFPGLIDIDRKRTRQGHNNYLDEANAKRRAEADADADAECELAGENAVMKNSERSHLVKEGLEESQMQRIEVLMRLVLKVAERPDHNNIGGLLHALRKHPACSNMQKDIDDIRTMYHKLSINLKACIPMPSSNNEDNRLPREADYCVLWLCLERIWTMAEDLRKDMPEDLREDLPEDLAMPNTQSQRRFLVGWRQGDKDGDLVLRKRIAMVLPPSRRKLVITKEGLVNFPDAWDACHYKTGIEAWRIHAVHLLVPESVQVVPPTYEKWMKGMGSHFHYTTHHMFRHKAYEAAESLRKLLQAPQPEQEPDITFIDKLWTLLYTCMAWQDESSTCPHCTFASAHVFTIFDALTLRSKETGRPSISNSDVECFLMDMLCDLAGQASENPYLLDQRFPPKHLHSPGYTQDRGRTHALINHMRHHLYAQDYSQYGTGTWKYIPACLRNALRKEPVSEWPMAVVLAASQLPPRVPQPWIKPPKETLEDHPLMTLFRRRNHSCCKQEVAETCVDVTMLADGIMHETFVHAGLTGKKRYRITML